MACDVPRHASWAGHLESAFVPTHLPASQAIPSRLRARQFQARSQAIPSAEPDVTDTLRSHATLLGHATGSAARLNTVIRYDRC